MEVYHRRIWFASLLSSRGEQLRAGLASNGSLHDAAGAASAAMSDDIHPLAPGDEPTGDVTEDEVTRAVTRAML